MVILRAFEQPASAREALHEAVKTSESDTYHYFDATFLAEVAEAQRSNGDTAEALETFSRATNIAMSEGKASLRNMALSEIAARQTRLGLLDDAMNTIERIDVSMDREFAWGKVAETLAASGNFDDARRISDKISRPWTAVVTSLALSDAYLRAGRMSDAVTMLQRAEEIWRTESDVQNRTSMAMRLSTSHKLAGNFDAAAMWLRRAAGECESTTVPAGGPGPFAALNKIETTPGASARQMHFRTVAVAQARLGLIEEARQSFERAKVAAKGHQPGLWQKTVFWVIAKSEAEAGLPDDAMQTMEALPEADRDWRVYVEIASAMARANRLDEALELVRTRGGGIGGMSYVAKALLEIGDLKNALAVALQGSGTHFELRSIARQYALSGNLQPVMIAIDQAAHEQERMALTMGAIDGLLESERNAKQRHK